MSDLEGYDEPVCYDEAGALAVLLSEKKPVALADSVQLVFSLSRAKTA